MIKYFKEYIERTKSFLDKAPISSDEKTRLQHYSVFLLLGIPTMIIYGINNLLNGEYFVFLLICLSAIGLIIGWNFLKSDKKGKIIYIINAIIYSMLMLYLIVNGGTGGSMILWMYTLPLIVFFLLEKNEGLIFNAIVFIIALILLWYPHELFSIYNYPFEFKIRFTTSYLIVAAIAYWFEYFRSHYSKDIEQKNNSLEREIKERKEAQKEREKLIGDLQKALGDVKTLSGLFPICASCKKIRDDKGYWNQIESYIKEHSDAEFSHSICPECSKKLYPEYYEQKNKKDV